MPSTRPICYLVCVGPHCYKLWPSPDAGDATSDVNAPDFDLLKLDFPPHGNRGKSGRPDRALHHALALFLIDLSEFAGTVALASAARKPHRALFPGAFFPVLFPGV